MGSTEEQCRRLMAALNRNPDLLFRVAVQIRELKVASPWLIRSNANGHYRERRSSNRSRVAMVRLHRTRKVNPWEAMLYRAGDEDRKQENFPSESQAMQWADAELIARGYRLATGEEE